MKQVAFQISYVGNKYHMLATNIIFWQQISYVGNKYQYCDARYCNHSDNVVIRNKRYMLIMTHIHLMEIQKKVNNMENDIEKKLTEDCGEAEEEKCEHGIDSDECCAECREKAINGLIGISGYDKNSELRLMNLFGEDAEIVMAMKSGGIVYELDSRRICLDIDDFSEVDIDDDRAEDQVSKIVMDGIRKIVNEIVVSIDNE
jgi:hypothetical protein